MTWGLTGLLCFFLLSCNKKELMPAPVGEAIPFVDTTLSVKAYAETDTEHSIFWRAWRNSGIEAKLAARDADYRFTLFLPGNAAMETAGWNAARISRASKHELEQLVSYHVSPVQLIPGAIALQTGNIELETMLTEPDYNTMRRTGLSYFKAAGPFRYDLGIVEGQVRINNRQAGVVSESAVLRKASVFPISRVLQKPRKSTRQVLVEDGRFTLFLAIRRYNDSLYSVLSAGRPSRTVSVSYEQNQYVLGVNTSQNVKGINQPLPMLDYLSDTNYLYNHRRSTFIITKEIYQVTILAPTDEAFHKAGFHTLDDLVAFNHRATLPVPQDPGRCLPTDSILNHHFFGSNIRASENVTYNSNLGSYYAGIFGPDPPMLLYSNELRNEWVGNPVYRYFGTPQAHDLTHAADPLDFTLQGGEAVRVKVRGSAYEPATIIEKDIETYTGVIQVLDRLLIPPGMKLN
jgi:uncharacterized surface protein with fasciclin (FAS1) repeats